MNKLLRVGLLLVLAVPVAASAAGHVRIGGGYYHGGYYGHGYYGRGYYGGGYYAPYYGYYGYYGPGYWPGYYYAPPTTVYVEPEITATQPPASYWYYCAAAKGYYPYVTSCPSGWEAVPAQAPPQATSQAPAAAKPGLAPAQPAPPSGAVVYRFGDLLFASGKSDLQPAAQNSLAAMLAAIKKEPSRHVTVEGHTDSSGDADNNRELSQRRAEAVKQFLVEHGVPADNITAVGKGADAPIAGNDTPEGRKQNRRVDVIVG